LEREMFVEQKRKKRSHNNPNVKKRNLSFMLEAKRIKESKKQREGKKPDLKKLARQRRFDEERSDEYMESYGGGLFPRGVEIRQSVDDMCSIPS
jgi:hypothetical protein